MGQWVYKYGKFIKTLDLDNSNFKKWKVIFIKPEAEWSNYEQVENILTKYWKTELVSVEKDWDDLWLGVKG